MKAPRGYRNARDENNRPVIIPGNDARFIRWMFEGIARGKEQVELRQELKKEGYIVSKSNLSAILHNPVYTGKVKILANNDEPEHLVEGAHEGIISEELYSKVQSILHGNLTSRNRPKYNSQRPELFLRGNLICSKCGQKLTGSPSKGMCGTKYFYYHCNYCGKERYRAEKVNGAIDHIISDFQFAREANEVYRENEAGKDKQKQSELLRRLTKCFWLIAMTFLMT